MWKQLIEACFCYLCTIIVWKHGINVGLRNSAHVIRCRVDVYRPMCPRPKILGCCAPWTKRPLDIVSLTDVSRPWTASSMELAPSTAIAASVGLRLLMDQWGVWLLTRFIGLAPLHRMHARPTHRTPPLRSAKARGSCKSGVASLKQIWA